MSFLLFSILKSIFVNRPLKSPCIKMSCNHRWGESLAGDDLYSGRHVPWRHTDHSLSKEIRLLILSNFFTTSLDHKTIVATLRVWDTCTCAGATCSRPLTSINPPPSIYPQTSISSSHRIPLPSPDPVRAKSHFVELYIH